MAERTSLFATWRGGHRMGLPSLLSAAAPCGPLLSSFAGTAEPCPTSNAPLLPVCSLFYPHFKRLQALPTLSDWQWRANY